MRNRRSLVWAYAHCPVCDVAVSTVRLETYADGAAMQHAEITGHVVRIIGVFADGERLLHEVYGSPGLPF